MKKIAIIGAGPAGLSSSIHLAQSKKNFCIHIFEKDVIGENIICAEGFFDFFNKINIDLPEKMKAKKIILSYTEKIEINLPIHSNFLTFSRRLWQKKLAQMANSMGVQILEKTKIRKSDIIKMDSEYDYILDCSGFYGITHTFFPKKDVTLYRKGLVPAVQYQVEGDFSHLGEALYAKVFDNPPGYFWLFPKKEQNKINKANMGLGILVKDNNIGNLKNRLDNILNTEFPDYKIIKYSASPIPTKRLKNYRQNKIILLGDALGLCSPLHGGGIDSAYLSGYYVAQSILNNDFSYYENFLKEIDKRFIKERFILKLWKHFGSQWILKRLKNKGLFSDDLKLHPFSGNWLNKAIFKLFF